MASINVQFRIHDTGQVESWILNEDGSQTIYYAEHKSATEVVVRFPPMEALIVGEGILFHGLRFTPFVSTIDDGYQQLPIG